jgi:hypothetical protein
MADNSHYGISIDDRSIYVYPVGNKPELWSVLNEKYPELSTITSLPMNSRDSIDSVIIEEKSMLSIINFQTEAAVYLNPLIPDEKIVVSSIRRYPLNNRYEVMFFTSINSEGLMAQHVYLYLADNSKGTLLYRKYQRGDIANIPVNFLH